MSASRTLRYGLVGTGQMGRNHIQCIRETDGVELVALADPRTDSLEKGLAALGETVPSYDNHGGLLAGEALDAVVVATPNDTHAEIVCDALAAGVHVLGEKPMASTMEGCNRIAAAAAASTGFYQVGLELRYAPIWQRIRELLDRGEIGTLRHVWCKEFRGPWNLKTEQWITQKARSGGALVEKDCHHFDLFNWFVAERPARVAAFGSCDLVYGPERFEGVTPDVLDNAQVIVEYETGSVAALMLCMYCTGHRGGLEIGLIGTDGWMLATSGGTPKLEVDGRESGETLTYDFRLPPAIRKTNHGGAVYLEHQAFRDNILNGCEPLTGIDAAWWSTVVPLAAERAVEQRTVVDMREFAPSPMQD